MVRFLYSLDGRPAKDKIVYRAIDSVEDLLPEQEVHPDEEICSRRWIELTMDKLSLLVIVDYAPHLRILVSDPFDDASSSFGLDLCLSQFDSLNMVSQHARVARDVSLFIYEVNEGGAQCFVWETYSRIWDRSFQINVGP